MAKNKVSIDFVIGAYDRFSAAFAKFNAKIESATGAVSRMQAQVARFSQRSGLSRVAGAAGDVADAFAGIGDGAMESLDRVSGALGKMSLLLGGASGGMLALASATAEQAQAAERSAVALGVNAKDLQKLQYAASTVNVEAEDMTDILSDLTEKMVEAEDSEDLAAMFKALGVSVKNSNGTMKNSAQVIMEISDAFSRMQDGPVKTKLAIELLGDEGRKLIPVLNRGSSGLRELGREAEQAGLIFDDTARTDARRFQDALKGVGSQLSGLRHAIGQQLMPVLAPVIEKFEGWLKLNRDLIAAKVSEWVQRLADRIPAFLDGVDRWLSAGGTLLGWVGDFVDAIGGAENALMLLAAYMSAPLVKALLEAGRAVTGFGLALATTPIGAFLVAIGLLVAAGWWLYNNWEEISAGMKKFCTEIKNAVQGVADVQEAADLHGLDLEDTDALMDPENARILSEAARRSSAESSATSVPESTDSGFSDLVRSGTVSSETVRREEKEVTHKVELVVPAGMEARVDRQASDAVTVKRDNMGYGWSFAGV